MSFALEQSERESWLDLFDDPISWSFVEGTQSNDALRGWRVLEESSKRMLLAHSTGAVSLLDRDGDTITKLELVEGPAARRLLAKHGFRPDKRTKRIVQGELGPGSTVELGLDRAFPRRLGLTEFGDIDGVRRIRIGAEGVLELRHRDGKVVKASWRTGGEALDLIEAYLADRIRQRGG